MYLETRGGPADIKEIQNPTSNGSDSSTSTEISLNDNVSGQFTIGWTLPRGRGQYLLTYQGVADGDYELDSTGYLRSYLSPQGTSGGTPTDQLPWWHMTIDNGQLHTTKVPPVWDRTIDDADDDGFADSNEFRYPTTTVNLSDTVPADLGTRLTTWDLLYRREFGGVKIRSAWTAGVRYLDLDGAVPTPSWLVGPTSGSGFGFSDGVLNKMILMQQSTSGWGPTGSGEIDFNFFRQRLTLYGLVRAAFLIQKLETDSGAFTYFAPIGTGVFIPGSGRFQESVSKTGWNTTFEVGARVKLLEGFHLIVDWNTSGYLDTFLLPERLSIPANASQVSLGTVATYISRDFVVSTVNVGLSFQF